MTHPVTPAARVSFPANQPQLFDGGKLIGATLLCLVLGTWISLVHKNMPRPSATTALAAHATPSSRAPLPAP